MPKQGTEYELFVKSVYECLNQADGLADVQIQHDVKIMGAAGVEHQLDLFWTFKIGGVAYRVVVECKDYNRHVSKEKVLAFHSVLQDIGNIHGIFASKMGFQVGAKEYASKYGIQLMEIRPPIDSDWDGRIKDINIELHVRSMRNVSTQLFINKAKAEEMGVVPSVQDQYHMNPDAVSISFGQMRIGEATIEEHGIKTMQELVRLLPQHSVGKECVCSFSFEDAVIHIDDQALPIDGIVFTYDVHETVERITIKGDKAIKAIVKNVQDGSETNIDEFGRVNVRDSL